MNPQFVEALRIGLMAIMAVSVFLSVTGIWVATHVDQLTDDHKENPA